MRGGAAASVYSAGSWTWIFAPEPSISAVGSIGFFLRPSGRFGYASMSSPWWASMPCKGRTSEGSTPSTRRRTGTILTQGSYVAFRRAPRAIATSFRNQNKLSAQKTAEHIRKAAWTPARSASHGFASRFQ